MAGPLHTPTRPVGRRVHRWTPKIASTPSRQPSSIIDVAPPGVCSSACWKRRTISPLTSSRLPCRISANPSSIVVCPSCPQACMTSGTWDLYGTSFSSWIGRASISARNATVGPGCAPLIRPTTPLPPTPSVTPTPNALSRPLTHREVSCSRKDSSGRWCRCLLRCTIYSCREGASSARRITGLLPSFSSFIVTIIF